jgi:hypothetical protein
MASELRYNAATGESEVVDLPEPTLAERKAAMTAATKAKFGQIMLDGYAHNFGGSAGWRTLDMRDADDKANWTLLLIKCQGLNAAGAGSTSVTIRSQDNETFATTASTALTAMQAMLGWGEAAFARKWALEAEIEAVSTEAELTAIDINANWP